MMATSEFGKAFAAARKAGDKSFEFNGKKYTTKTAEDVSKEKKGAMDTAQRGRSDIMRDLTKVEQNMPAGTTELAKQKIAEAKRKATEEYATAGKAEDAKQYKPRPTSGEPKQTTNKPVASSASADKPASKPAGRGVTRNPSPGFFEKIRARGEKDLAERGLKKGGSINGIAKRGLTNCKTV